MPVELGIGGQLDGWPVAVFCLGLALMFSLYVRGVKGAILISIVVMTVVAIIVEQIADIGPTVAGDGVQPARAGTSTCRRWPDDVVGMPDLQLLGEFSLLGSFENVGVVTAALFVFTLLLADFFDTMGTMTAIGAEAGLLDEEGIPPNTQRILIVDSLAAAAGGAARCLEQHVLHRVGLGCRRRRPHRPGQRRDRRAVPARDVLRPAGGDRPERGGRPALVLVGFLMMSRSRTSTGTTSRSRSPRSSRSC